jgi:hypothetical protein
MQNSQNHRLVKAIADTLTDLRERGWEYPIYAISASTNGCFTVVEFVADGVDARLLLHHDPDKLARLPIHLIFVDSSGRSSPAVVTLLPPQFKAALQ